MADWNVQEIVDLLIKDETLVQAKTRFARFLHIPENSLRDFEHRYQQNSDIHAYLCEVLEEWKRINGNEATISSLTNILRENEFVASADRLQSHSLLCNFAKLQIKEPVFISGAINKLTDWKVGEIVDLLVKDEGFNEARQRFARALDIPTDRLTDFVHSYKQHSNSHTFFCSVLEEWKSIIGNKATISLLENILRENNFISSADRLSSHSNSAHITVFGAKKTIFNFVGREQELKELNALLEKTKSCVVLSSAMGGKGKTELCRRFIQQLPKDIDTLVIWISGDGQQQFLQSFSTIGQAMKVQTTDSAGKPLSVEEIIENISIKTNSKWVVIIDNVDEIFPNFYAAIDTLQRNGAFVVVTSRKSDIQAGKHIFLKDLEDEDAWEFVRSSLDNIISQELVVELCKCLQNYPLALQQAVAFIKYKQSVEDESYGIAEYLQELNSSTSLALDHKIPSTGYGDTVLKVFELTLSKILGVHPGNNFNQLWLLYSLSLVQPDGIQKEILKELSSFFELKESFDSSITIFKSFSLIRVNKGEVSIHRIVQKLIRDRMKAKNMFLLVIKTLLLKHSVDKLTSKEIFPVIEIWNHALPELEIIKKMSNFALEISYRLFDLSLYRDLKEFSEITFQHFVKALGSDHKDTLRMQHQLGLALEFNGEYEEALVKLQEVWEKEKKVLGEEHEETLNCAGQIAIVLWRLKRFAESLEWNERVLKSFVKVHGENHKSTMNTKNNMAIVLIDQGKIEEALTIYKQVLEWKEKELGHEDPETLTTRHNIACCLYNQGKFVEAKKEFEEVLELKVKVQGEEHPDTLTTKYWLSFTLYSLGQKELALEMMEQLLISQEKVLGLNHPHTNYTRDKISEWRIERDFL